MTRLQAQKACNFIEFTDMVHHLLKAAWGDDWGTFCEAFPNGLDPENVQMPMITYRIILKEPGTVGNGHTKEIKPRYRDWYSLPPTVDGGPEAITVYSQVLDYHVLFEIWHENNTKADELAERFEDFMMTYTGYMLSQGVGQLIFQQMTGDDGSNNFMRDRATVRNYRYLVRLEKHVAVPSSVIKEVIGKVSISTDLATDQDQDTEAIDFK